ncbi:MAG: HPr(Ser) kinase/phosphatase [Clostridia bacterium]|nr:HPr(Ser) kinase/phosphatase [Clostridia bacterium]
MKTDYHVNLAQVINELGLEEIYLPQSAEEILISSNEINRPGLQLAGYFEYFDAKRIQIFGISEISFLKSLGKERATEIMHSYLSQKPAAIVIARGLELDEEYIKTAEQYKVPILATKDTTSGFASALIAYLNLELAPRITRHGVFVEVYGEGILLLGESGVGKSETAIELVKRGHRLIADDAVEIRRVSNKSLVGSAPDNIRHFIELRGIGIINASRIFGIGSVKLTEKIDLVINMEHWDSNKNYDRMGLEDQTTEILGLEVPSITVPVKPGRNLAVIIEVASMNSRQKKLGYNAAKDLLKKLGMQDEKH